jgi:hypothetical protein
LQNRNAVRRLEKNRSDPLGHIIERVDGLSDDTTVSGCARPALISERSRRRIDASCPGTLPAASPAPDAWRSGPLTIAGVLMGVGDRISIVAILAAGTFGMGFDIEARRALSRWHSPARPPGGRLVGLRPHDHRDAGRERHRHDGVAARGNRLDTRRGSRRLIRPGSGHDAGCAPPGALVAPAAGVGAGTDSPRYDALEGRGFRDPFNRPCGRSTVRG